MQANEEFTPVAEAEAGAGTYTYGMDEAKHEVAFMRILRDLVGGNLRQYGMFIALAALIIFFEIGTGGKFLTPSNLQNLLNGYSYVLIMAIGMLFVIIMGHIDLSVGSVAAVVGICMALSIRSGPSWFLIIGIPVGVIGGVAIGVALGRFFIRQGMTRILAILAGVGVGLVAGAAIAVLFSWLIHTFGIPWWGGLLIGIGVGAIAGAWQGTWLAFIGVPGFITTLAGQMLFRGLDQWVGKAESISVPKQIIWIGNGYLPQIGPTWGTATGLNNLTILLGLIAIGFVIWTTLRSRARTRAAGGAVPALWIIVLRLVLIVAFLGVVTYMYASGRPGTSFPVTGCILIIFAGAYHFLSTRTPMGRSVYAVGGNRIAAELTGISNKRVYFLMMLNMSLLAAVAGIMFIGRSQSTGPGDGVGWELDAIAAVFIGGAAVTGGVGTVVGAVIGGLVMAVLNYGLYSMGVGSDLAAIIRGLVLLVAVAFDLASKAQGRPSLIGTVMRGLGLGQKQEAAAETATSQETDLGALALSANGSTSAPQDDDGIAVAIPPSQG